MVGVEVVSPKYNLCPLEIFSLVVETDEGKPLTLLVGGGVEGVSHLKVKSVLSLFHFCFALHCSPLC